MRWGRIRKSQSPLAFAGECVTGMWVSGICGAVGWGNLVGTFTGPAVAGTSSLATVFLISHLFVWSFLDLVLATHVSGSLRPSRVIDHLLRETFALPLWLATLCGNTVLWRGKRLALLPGGVLAE